MVMGVEATHHALDLYVRRRFGRFLIRGELTAGRYNTASCLRNLREEEPE